ncbi:MAG: 16S rRNA (cytidine(1402)-2'-O)-methyltransferase [Elusimicrobia bacterium RIFOXYA2_FULL_50_26]|nr:MAG: 16S rRNA (cytidine(1402)-2'-O)-methyltransferase [Elusimicrobia bacterium RIFOXYA2_FULL_50_26]OGS23122.1 MAG: 16S rRNA (cytidine(1402)-2'-O)-methyltransferase [Elusimicrobia bacterium RIFOXYB2_FULL_50_12]
MAGTLYLVPTPIGNLEDITLRALNILRSVDIVVCEDTRHTVKLLNHFEIQKPLISFFSYNQARRLPQLIEALRSGKNLAVVSDSGTPGISDPGFFLVRAAIEGSIAVISLPGPSASLTALVASGLPTDKFIFLGFLKRKPGKMKKELQEAVSLGVTVIFYESPHRIVKTISLCREIFAPETPVVLAREITKKFEEYIRGTLAEVDENLRRRSEIKGEFVVLLSPLQK